MVGLSSDVCLVLTCLESMMSCTVAEISKPLASVSGSPEANCHCRLLPIGLNKTQPQALSNQGWTGEN